MKPDASKLLSTMDYILDLRENFWTDWENSLIFLVNNIFTSTFALHFGHKI